MDDDAGYAVAAWREEGRWSVALLPPRATESLDSFLMALRQLIAEGGALGFLVVDEDFFVAVRMMPDGAARLLLSDVGAALEFPLAEEVADMLEADLPEDDEELDEVEPVGDISFAADMGMPVSDMELILDDPDLYPDDQVFAIASRLGFEDQLSAALER
ncbi:MAG: tRNA adenosine deaminase-associated protein [Candidatus Nanopelagicales bacterium]|jgi:putative tRNA adenosine deaminase-associated protein